MLNNPTDRVAHTPGPWTAISGGAETPTADGAFSIRADSQAAFAQWGLMGDYRGCEVATIRCNPAARNEPSAWAVIEANARLIAAAPEMAETLRHLYGQLVANEVGEYMDVSDCYIRIGDLLAKAGVKLS